MKALFIDSTQPILIEKWQSAGFNCDYLPNFPKEEVIKRIGNLKVL